MKSRKITVWIALLALSVVCNCLLLCHIVAQRKLDPSILKLTNHNDMIIYCERSRDVKSCRFDMDEGLITVGDSQILNTAEEVFFFGSKGETNLSQYDALGFVVNSDGELLYSLTEPVLKQETVFVTPKGKKYHSDASCAGKTGFEIKLNTAIMFDRTACNICVG